MADHAGDRYEFNGFHLDTGRRLLLGSDGLPVALTPKAVDTLLYLIENRGAVVTKEALLKAIWPDTVVEENNLNQNISALRRVLGGNRKENRFIVTVQSRGYSFVAPVKAVSGRVSDGARTFKTLCVLPFRPLVQEDSDESLELGMADTLIARLSTIDELVVRPISSVRSFTRADQDSLMAARQLGADSVLEGTLQKYGSKVRVSARLLNTEDGKALWAGTFDEPFTDIFILQDAIAGKVVSALKLHLDPTAVDRLTKHDTLSAEAYRLYLKGRFYWWNTDPEEFKKSRDYFHRAVEADPNYALGYCGLNSFYGFSAAWGLVEPEAAWAKAEWAIKRALELDDSLAEAHLGNAAFLMVHRDWQGAEAEVMRGIELNQSFDEIHYVHSFLLMVLGRYEESITAAKRALECNPFSARINLNLGNLLYFAGEWNQAETHYRQSIELNPKDAPTHQALGDTLEQLEDFHGALAAWERAATLSGDSELANLFQRLSAERFEDAVRESSRIKLGRLSSASERGEYIPAAHFLRQHLRAGNLQKAYEYLPQAARERNVFSLLIARDPQFAKIQPALREISARATG
jgi:DNA-binding winged helix-turn-helix (wHTH) protein/Tfp pilus assembly protein PilF